MSNIQNGAERMPHDLFHLGFLAGQICRLITISTYSVISCDSFLMDAVWALRLFSFFCCFVFFAFFLLFSFFFFYFFICSCYRWRLLRDGRRCRSPSFSIASWPCY